MAERFTIAEPHRVKWGQLVKQWAKGEIALPRNIDELKEQCVAKGITATVPDYIKGLVFVQNDKHVLTIRLPPKDMLIDGEQTIQSSNTAYPLPDFYLRFFDDPHLKQLDRTTRLELHSARIGEYTMNVCL